MHVRSSPGTVPSIAARIAALAMLPMFGALVGASIDERLRLGVTVWRSACLASGLALGSVIAFTFELLPYAVAGALLGGLAVLAFALRCGPAHARLALAAHAGCAFAMPVALVSCALALPLPIMLAVETMLAGAVGVVVLQVIESTRSAKCGTASVVLRTRARPRA